ncbi:MAG: hypothetical protein JRI71_10175 [Deltaproteobacteria bacterium]|nr:hypothetical protein [Deltaproteobacteria bacterium]
MTRQSIFETISPGDVYILTITDGCAEYIANVDGVAVFKTACLEESDE